MLLIEAGMIPVVSAACEPPFDAVCSRFHAGIFGQVLREGGLLVIKLKRMLCVLMALAVLAIAGGCARTPQLAKPSASEGADILEVTGKCSADLVDNNEVVRITGTCNLMDGTNGIVSILGANGATLDKRKFTKGPDEISFDFPVEKSWPQVVYGFISFDTQQSDRQPDEVTKAYGKKFQNLDGPDVIWDAKGVIAVFQSEPVEIPGHGA